MNILIIGGTRFQGRYLVDMLLERGHTVTVFHKGSHAIPARKGLTDLTGNRDNPADLSCLADRSFDACIDTCAYFPAQVDRLANILRVDHYSLISSVYVYADNNTSLNEHSRLDTAPIASDTSVTPQNYGALKGLCEQRAHHHFSSACLIIRPSIIIGPGDHTERMSFWMRMVAKHHKRPEFSGLERSIQLLDVRDLARFVTLCVEARRNGPVNVCGKTATFRSVLDTISDISGHDCAQRNIAPEDLPRLGLDRLPYLDSTRNGTYDRRLSLAWGFTERRLDESLRDIYVHEKRQDFPIHLFQEEEAAILRLFS